MKLLKITWISLGLMVGYSAGAQTVKQLSLQEAIALGLKNSKQVKISLSRVQEAGAVTQERKDNRLPDLDISGQYLRMNQPKVSLNPDLVGESSDPSGGGPQVAPKYLMLGQASLEMPLFAGFRIKNGIRSAEYLEKAAQLDADAQQQEVVMNIVAAYINLYKAREAVKLVEESLQQSQQRVKDFTNMEQNGILAKNDLLKAQLQESNTSLALLDAKNNSQVANYNMDLLLGLDEETALELDSLGDADLPQIESVGELREQAVTNREDLQALAQREKASATAIKIAKADYLPSVGFRGGYMAADLNNILTLTNAMNFGVGISFNLASLYKGGAKVQQAEEKHEQVLLMRAQLSDQVKSQVFKSFSDYQESVQRMAVYEKAKQQAEENYRIVKNKHQNSLATTTELLDADIDQFQARLNLKYSQVDAIMAYCKLLQVSGQLDAQKIDQVTRK